MTKAISVQHTVNRTGSTGVPAVGSLPPSLANVLTDSNLIHETIQVVGTAAEAISVGDVTDKALLVIENQDTDAGDGALLEVGYDDSGFVAFFEVPVGERAQLPRVSSLASLQLKSDTAATNVLVALYKITPPA